MRCAFADRSCLLPTPRYWRATTHNPRIPAQSCYLRADSFIESLAEPRPRAERSRVNMSFLNPALRPLLSGNLPLAQAKRRCYRPNPQPLGNLANWRSGPRALITQSLYHPCPRPGRLNPAVSSQIYRHIIKIECTMHEHLRICPWRFPTPRFYQTHDHLLDHLPHEPAGMPILSNRLDHRLALRISRFMRFDSLILTSLDPCSPVESTRHGSSASRPCCLAACSS